MIVKDRDALYVGAAFIMGMDEEEVDEALAQAGLNTDTCHVKDAISACRQWKDRQSGTVMRESVFKPVARTEPYSGVAEAAQGYCRESPELGRIVKREEEDGILFTGPDTSPDDEFIPFWDLGYNTSLGFYKKSVFPNHVSIYDER